jgi:hypothetical protein
VEDKPFWLKNAKIAEGLSGIKSYVFLVILLFLLRSFLIRNGKRQTDLVSRNAQSNRIKAKFNE